MPAARPSWFIPLRAGGGGRRAGAVADWAGDKAAGLLEAAGLGLPVPAGFIISAQACAAYHEAGQQIPEAFVEGLRAALKPLEQSARARFGDADRPLLLALRASPSTASRTSPGPGAVPFPASAIPGAVLHLGLSESAAVGLTRRTGDQRLAYDCYRRLIAGFAATAAGLDAGPFTELERQVCVQGGVSRLGELPARALMELCAGQRALLQERTGRAFPQEPWQQLLAAVRAMWAAWGHPRLLRWRRYREAQGAPIPAGLALVVQVMVLANRGGASSGAGFFHTRDPRTGGDQLTGRFLPAGLGSDLAHSQALVRDLPAGLRRTCAVLARLERLRQRIERGCGDARRVDFALEEGRCWVTGLSPLPLVGAAAVRAACELAQRRRITRAQALGRVTAADLAPLLADSFEPAVLARAEVLTQGWPASPGAAVGRASFDSADALRRARAGEAVILVRRETFPEDMAAMALAQGVLTTTGGMTSHAAVVARGQGLCCVTGAGAIQVDPRQKRMTVGGRGIGEDAVLSLDGSTGRVILGPVVIRTARPGGELATLLGWADQRRRLGVLANADTPEDARRARQWGASGIGLCRTEHMFFAGDRIHAMRRMILAQGTLERAAALDQLGPLQQADFTGLLAAMDGLPVVIRLLDPPLHEFLPPDEPALRALARRLGLEPRSLRQRVRDLRERNPMLGHRGCRLCVTYPEILRMQVRAVALAARDCRRRGIDARPRLMFPLISAAAELRWLRQAAQQALAGVGDGDEPAIPIGAMVESPRAALLAADLAPHADFLSFGTNDLTQLTFGISRDDVAGFLPEYLGQALLPADPFATLDVAGVGRLVRAAVGQARRVRPGLSCGLCGEHGGDPASIAFCHAAGLDYVSCSPPRVPVARLAAGQAAMPGRRPA